MQQTAAPGPLQVQQALLLMGPLTAGPCAKPHLGTVGHCVSQGRAVPGRGQVSPGSPVSALAEADWLFPVWVGPWDPEPGKGSNSVRDPHGPQPSKLGPQ